MAKSKRGAKKQAVQDMIAQHPNAKTSELVKLLAGKGIKVSANYVYTLKTMRKVKKAKVKRQKAIAAGRGMVNGDPIELLRGIKDLAVKAGGIGHLKEMVDLLAE